MAKTHDECNNIAGDEECLVLGIFMYCDYYGTELHQQAGLENHLFSNLPFLIVNVDTNLSWNVVGYLSDLEMNQVPRKLNRTGRPLLELPYLFSQDSQILC